MPFGSDKEDDGSSRVASTHQARVGEKSAKPRAFAAALGVLLRALLVGSLAIIIWVLFDLVA